MFAPTGGQIHPVVGEIFLQKLNESGGLLGRPVEWVTLDDESSPDKAAELYEQLISDEEVDLIIGPHGSASIAAAMEVAEGHGMVFPHHTGSLTYAYTYDRHFPMWANGLYVNITMAEQQVGWVEATRPNTRCMGDIRFYNRPTQPTTLAATRCRCLYTWPMT
jgi:hypothetical protein